MYLGSLYVTSFNEFGRYWQVTLQADGQFRNRVEDINLLQVRNKWGQMVPLGTLVNMREIGGPVMVTRYNLYTAAPITGNLPPGRQHRRRHRRTSTASPSETLPRLHEDGVDRADVHADPGGQHRHVRLRPGGGVRLPGPGRPVRELVAAAGGHPGRAVVPALLGRRRAAHAQSVVNIFVQIGLVVLVGLACKNAILIVEFATASCTSEGQPRFEATLEASRLRLRPILMTSFAFILGVVPLVIATGAGAEMRRSLGTAVFSGMLGVTLFGIFLTPVFFYVIQGLGETRLFASGAAPVDRLAAARRPVRVGGRLPAGADCHRPHLAAAEAGSRSSRARRIRVRLPLLLGAGADRQPRMAA